MLDGFTIAICLLIFGFTDLREMFVNQDENVASHSEPYVAPYAEPDAMSHDEPDVTSHDIPDVASHDESGVVSHRELGYDSKSDSTNFCFESNSVNGSQSQHNERSSESPQRVHFEDNDQVEDEEGQTNLVISE